ncbi:hypothetical protein RB614_24670 [Phytohabitans sp. ZYX-F-186]|uniref:Uncharacterized protein n=1 Tax=Phytohabitans maris TaxID=3071409 RepID=A0ABU0ZL12_9ACTN|nr:hypothetical protein [Phytohabitans sp. ZYX-F-186]MDQ7907720.1 hypothetical protein [Phytohabitans sp. ZYX-F-186]
MRHLWSLLAGVVVAPLTWVLVSVGQSRSSSTVAGWAEARRYDTIDLIEPAAYLVVAGILLGVIGTLRFSPLGPLLAGLLLITPYAGLFADPLAVRDTVPDNWAVLDRDIPLLVPLDNGTLLLLGVLLVIATFSVQRWRRWPLASGYAPEPFVVKDEPDTLPDVVTAPASLSSFNAFDTRPLGEADETPTVPSRPSGGTPWSAPPAGAGKRTSGES